MGEGEEAKKPFFLVGLINEKERAGSLSFFTMRKMEEEKDFIIL